MIEYPAHYLTHAVANIAIQSTISATKARGHPSASEQNSIYFNLF